jgi:hypothetical protein
VGFPITGCPLLIALHVNTEPDDFQFVVVVDVSQSAA